MLSSDFPSGLQLLQFVILESEGVCMNYSLHFFLTRTHSQGPINLLNPVVDLSVPNQTRLGYINNTFYRKGGEKDDMISPD